MIVSGIEPLAAVRAARHLLLLGVLALPACERGALDGPPRHHLQGAATYNGIPIPAGEIRFDPDTSKGNQGPGGVAEIVNGRYSTRSEFGAVGGPHIVRINGFDGQSKSELEPLGKPLFPEQQQSVILPAQSGTLDLNVQLETP